ncbi:hypothetical protein VP01_2323g3 [Puccinia sorghi]|uniref:Uncharacterized protein n=1 Tax=Puccinia sorghi TaxID=27349 RepID=A0A0L6V7I9_9BASI|nr:hypothetical protein VP01_2323g3 [Puccinia sorghi]
MVGGTTEAYWEFLHVNCRQVELIYLTAAINSITILTQENFSLWPTRVINYLDLQVLKEFFLLGKGTVLETDKKNVRILITSKLDLAMQANVINHSNKDNIIQIWKSIDNYFASQHYANQPNVNGFITHLKSAIEQLHKVRINKDMVCILLSLTLLHTNQQAIGASSQSNPMQQVSLFTDPLRKFKPDAQSTKAPHPKSRCWMLLSACY